VLAPLLDVWDHISLQHLLEERAPLSSPVYLGLLVLFILVLIAGSVLTIWARRWSRGNRLHEAVLGRYAGAAAWIAGYGVIAVGLRFTQAIFFSKRLWVFLAVVGLLVCVVHFIWYWVKRYPIEIGAYLEDQRRRRYLTPARASTAARRTRRPRAR
jgi:ABC-type uncharacterized transport system fused permease/ATPase subunit